MSNQIVISSGAKVRSLEGVLTGTAGIVNALGINVPDGIPQLDGSGKILVSQLPNSVMEYKGTWNAATNTPTLANGTGNQGDVYLCNVAGTTDFGAGPITFFVGDQVIYSGSIWQRASGATGTVTSVAVTESGDALTITGSPITTSGTINIGFSGISGQYVNGAGGLTTFPTLISSIGLSMPSAFSVANSPLTANGTIAVTGAGVASQYIRGDGTLANFPSSGGGGGSVSYYLNGSVNQGTFVGNTYYEMSKVPVIGAGTDFTINANGYISQFITDAGDPALLEIPAGNWNFEMYFSASSGGGSPSFYVELYKYNGSTFTLIASSSATPEGITNGTAIDLYTTALAVPTTALTLTDRLAVRVYVTHSGRTITLHTENSHLCQVITTFSTGITALNGLTAQVQFLATGTSGTDFNISSTTATHTFNLPTASATNRGLLSSANWSNFNTAYNDSIISAAVTGTTTKTLTLTQQDAGTITASWTDDNTDAVTSVFGRTGAVVATEGDYSLTQLSDVTITTPSSGQVLKYNGTAWINDTDANTGTVTSVAMSVPTGLSVSGSPITSSGTLGVTFTAGYSIPTNASQTTWDTAYTNRITSASFPLSISSNAISISLASASTAGYLSIADWNTFNGKGNGTVTSVGLSSATSGVTIGSSPITTSGTITLAISTATTSQNGLLSSTDWTTFNSKQNALTNPVTGTGLSGAIPKFTTTGSTIGSSIIYDNGTQIGINTLSPTFTLDVNGTSRVSGVLTLSSTISNGTYTYTLPSATGTLALTSAIPANPVGGTGTTNYLPKFTGASTIGNSAITDDGTTVTLISRILQVGSYLNLYSGAYSVQSIPSIRASSSNNMIINAKGSGTLYFNYEDGTGGFYFGNGASGQAAFITSAGAATFSSTVEATSFIPSGATVPTNGMYLSAANTLNFATNTTNRLSISSTGNLGLGVTPSAFTSSTSIKSFEIGSLGNAIYGVGAADLRIMSNTYFDGSYRYAFSGALSSLYTISDGNFKWYNAPSGTAGNAISFTQAMTLDASGRLGIGTTSPTTRLTIGGSTDAYMNFNPTSYRNFIIGSDVLGYILYDNNASAYRMVVTSAGNLLVGTTTDAGYKLDVNGTGRFSNILKVSGNSALGASVTGGMEMAYFSAEAKSRIFIGNGAGYLFSLSSRVSSVTADLFTITDTGAATFSQKIQISAGGLRIGTSATENDRLIVVNGTDLTTGSTQYLEVIAPLYNGNITNLYGRLQYATCNGGIITNAYMMYLGSFVGTSTYSNRWSLYQESTTEKNYFGGNVLIGTTTDAGQKLQVNGITKTNSLSLGATTFSSSTTMTDAYFFLEFTGGAGVTLTMYDSSGNNNTHFIKNSSSVSVSIAAHSGGVIMGLTSGTGSSSITLGAFKTVQLISRGGGAWYIMYQTT